MLWITTTFMPTSSNIAQCPIAHDIEFNWYQKTSLHDEFRIEVGSRCQIPHIQIRGIRIPISTKRMWEGLKPANLKEWDCRKGQIEIWYNFSRWAFVGMQLTYSCLYETLLFYDWCLPVSFNEELLEELLRCLTCEGWLWSSSRRCCIII